MKKLTNLFAVLGVLAAAASCTPDNPLEPSKQATSIEVNPSSVSVDEKEQAVDVKVTANGTWAVVNVSDWITVNPKASEKGNEDVTVTISANSVDGVVGKPRSAEIYFTSLNATDTLVVNQAGNNDLLIESIPYSIDFCASQENWTINDVKLGEGMSYCWTATTNYGYKASAYISACLEAESWLISPEFNLKEQTVCILAFSHAMNKGTNAKLAVKARKDGGDWADVTVPTWPAGTDWNFVESGDIDLSAYCGGKLQIAFVYGSTIEDAPTWEINTLELTNVSGPKFGMKSVEPVEVDALATSTKLTVTGNVDWTATASEGATVDPASGKGGSTITVSFPKNEDRTAGKTYTVTVSTKEAVDPQSYTITINQAKAQEANYKTFKEIIEAGAGTYDAKDAVVVAVGNTNTVLDDGTALMFAYDKNKFGKVGYKVTLNGATTTYNGCPEWNNPYFEKTDSVAVTYPEAVNFDQAAFTAYVSAPVIEYVVFEGVKSGYYVTFGESAKMNVYSNVSIPDGKVKVYGYTIGYYEKNTCINVVATSFEEIKDVPAAKIYINEVSCGEKKLELYNASDAAVELKNYTLKQRNDSTAAYKEWNFASLAEAVTIPANGFVVVNCKQTEETTGPTFGLSGTKGFQLQLTYGEELVDSVDNLTTITTIEDTQSYGRKTDGGEEWTIFGTPSLGETNANGKLVVEATTCAEINAAIIAGKTSIVVDFADYVEVTYVNGSSVFAEDATGGILLYGTGAETNCAYNGLRFKGYFVVGAKLFNNVPEITSMNVAGMVKDYNPKYPCTNLTVAQLVADYDKYVNRKVRIADVKVADGWQGSTDRNGVVAQGTDSLNVYCQVKTDTLAVATGCEGHIVGWPTYYKTTKQIGFWPHAEAGKTYFTVTKAAPDPDAPVVKTYTTCAAANAAILAGETSFKLDFSTPVAVTKVAADGKSVYLMDNDNGGGLLIYNADINAMATAAKVDHNWGVKGEINVTAATVFNGLPEITGMEISASNLFQQWKYPCKNLTIAEFLADTNKWLNCKIKMTGVTVTDGWSETTDKNGKIEKDGSEVALFVKDPSNTTTVKTGCVGDAVVWGSMYKTPQVYLLQGSHFTVTKEAPEEPADTVAVTVYKNCAELQAAILAKEAAPLKCNFESPAEITLMGADSKSIFLQDATGGMLVYSADIYTALKAKSAQAGVGLSGEFSVTAATVFNGLPEVTGIDISGAKVAWKGGWPCKYPTIAELLTDEGINKYLNCKVVIDGVSVVDGWSASDKNGKISKDGNEIAVYVKNTAITQAVTTGSKGKFVGFVSINNTTKQVTVWEDKKFTASSMVSEISMPADLQLSVDSTKTIVATTNSTATITYKSLDEAVATVSAEGAVKGIAAGTTKIVASVEATGVYTAASDTCVVTVLGAGVKEDKVQTIVWGTDLTDNKGTVGDITFSVDKGNGSNAPAYNPNDKGIRCYQGSNFTFAVASGVIKKIELTVTGSYTGSNVTVSEGTIEGNVWKGEASSVTVYNDKDKAGTNVQLRFTKAVITYGEASK